MTNTVLLTVCDDSLHCVFVCLSLPLCVCIQSASLNSVLSTFRSICGEDGVSLGEAVREQHGKDESVHRSVSLQLSPMHIVLTLHHESLKKSLVPVGCQLKSWAGRDFFPSGSKLNLAYLVLHVLY